MELDVQSGESEKEWVSRKRKNWCQKRQHNSFGSALSGAVF